MSISTPDPVLSAQTRDRTIEPRTPGSGRSSGASGMDAELQQRFWEAQLAFLAVAPPGSDLLDLLAAADRRAALVRLVRAGKSVLTLPGRSRPCDADGGQRSSA